MFAVAPVVVIAVAAACVLVAAVHKLEAHACSPYTVKKQRLEQSHNHREHIHHGARRTPREQLADNTRRAVHTWGRRLRPQHQRALAVDRDQHQQQPMARPSIERQIVPDEAAPLP